MLETALWATFSDHLLHMSHRHTVYYVFSTYSFSSVQLLSSVLFFVTPWTAVCQAFLFVTNSRSLLKFTSKESVMPSNHLTICSPPLLLLPSIFPSITVFSNESVLRIRWPRYWSFSFSLSPSNEYSGLISPNTKIWMNQNRYQARGNGHRWKTTCLLKQVSNNSLWYKFESMSRCFFFGRRTITDSYDQEF